MKNHTKSQGQKEKFGRWGSTCFLRFARLSTCRPAVRMTVACELESLSTTSKHWPCGQLLTPSPPADIVTLLPKRSVTLDPGGPSIRGAICETGHRCTSIPSTCSCALATSAIAFASVTGQSGYMRHEALPRLKGWKTRHPTMPCSVQQHRHPHKN